MTKPVKIRVVQDDVTEFPADLLLLKFARSFHGADETVAVRLLQRAVCTESEISPENGEAALVLSEGAIVAERVLFLGTPRLSKFRYREMRALARRAIELIGARQLPVRTLATTVHGAGYGLDIEESLQAMVFGFQQGIAAGTAEQLEEIVFVERNPRRYEVIRAAVHEIGLAVPPTANPRTEPPPTGTATAEMATTDKATTDKAQAPTEPKKKRCVFVAMPFDEEFEDVYQFGIYAAVRRCGYVCEKVDESVFAGSIIDRITEGIRNSDFVIADLTQEKPNVYLEVGYAWGLERPVILLAREGQRLHFDLAHHKCIFYKTIGKLSEELEQTIRDMFGPE